VIEKNTRLLTFRPKNQDAIIALDKAWTQVKAKVEAIITQLKKGENPADKPAIFENCTLLQSQQEKI